MRVATPFLVPATRPAVIVLLLMLLVSVAGVLAAAADPRFPTRVVNIGVLAVLGFAGATGFLGGAALREVQHCRFTWVLPGVRGKTLSGFVVTAVVVTGLTAFLVRLRQADAFFVALFALGLAAFCLGSVLIDGRSRLRSLLHVTAALAVIAGSKPLGEWCADRPVWIVVSSSLVAGFCLQRSFGVAAFRELPFLPLAPLPGAFSLGQTRRYELEKMARRAPGRSGPGRVPVGDDPRSWVERAYFESVKGRPFAVVALELRTLLPMTVIAVAHAAFVRDDGGFVQALARTLYQIIVAPPFGVPLDEDIPRLIAPLFIAGIGGTVAFMRGAPLGARLPYPLSRANRARAVFRACLVENLGFLAVFGAGLFAVAMAVGMYLGYPVVPGYVPQILRAAVVTGAVVPAFQWFRLRTYEAGPRRHPNAIVTFSFALIAAVVAVSVWCAVAPKLLPSPLVELPVLAALYVGAQILYRRRLDHHFRTCDL